MATALHLDVQLLFLLSLNLTATESLCVQSTNLQT